MPELNAEDFNLQARGLACVILLVNERRGVRGDDAANIAGAALGEVLGQYLGGFGAVNRLRDIADILERQCLEEHRAT